MNELERFNDCLNELAGQPIPRQEATEAFHNLTGFMSLLIKINEREKIILTGNDA